MQTQRYAEAGVDVRRGYKAVELMKKHVATTMIDGVRSDLGGFSGLFELDLEDTPHPVLVCGTDGVGTKLKIAFALDRHDSVGIDCVAMCVNDVICCGAKPRLFLDYIALGLLSPLKVEQIVKGVSKGCRQAGCALIGGETAEMPGFYQEGEYDLAGFCVAVTEKEKIFDPGTIKPGDCLLALPSSGVHSNGFSLIRQVFSLDADPSLLFHWYESLGCTLGEELLTPTRIYVSQVLALAKQITIKGASHITGGGFYENIPRMLPLGLGAAIKKESIKKKPIFSLIQSTGSIPDDDMYATFNMGVGMVLAIDKEDADFALSLIPDAWVLGEVTDSAKVVIA
ncbi:phosphoribosylformylglycinamidine cyclo-ligase [Sphaerochaeta halotolerans]|jgi:phosphoribosylformylglycinamidine cyclo-ligase|uniref:Phosphoribosylformylglycinamidine cyclo-ligase n=1 Tax=Sphaerochaeta halotolerans TaxID=2293840 RepID=A0A372MJD5_9SPIR|nr:phosphoribosylformylglycinamidine cyclo-ligase [Sphaerochaeta halotolerans]MDN5334665.1 phosphoribosylformylglycinamidine cyclo-ligase [Sphaerochaeta sp.]RFU95895.1 phosphoribosylformylglycinamidine cyclo-ligase [Sphaerochaeta halotolerans]